jgi:hypothetical protein
MKEDEMGRASQKRGVRNAYSILVENHNGKREFVRPRHRYEYDIRMDLREIG